MIIFNIKCHLEGEKATVSNLAKVFLELAGKMDNGGGIVGTGGKVKLA